MFICHAGTFVLLTSDISGLFTSVHVKKTLINYALSCFFSSAVMPFLELPTGLIFAGINVPDHDLLFQQIAQTISSSTPPSSGPLEADDMEQDHNTTTSVRSASHVVILQSKDCTNLKSAQKSMIEQFLGLGIAGATNPLEVLRLLLGPRFLNTVPHGNDASLFWLLNGSPLTNLLTREERDCRTTTCLSWNDGISHYANPTTVRAKKGSSRRWSLSCRTLKVSTTIPSRTLSRYAATTRTGYRLSC